MESGQSPHLQVWLNVALGALLKPLSSDLKRRRHHRRCINSPFSPAKAGVMVWRGLGGTAGEAAKVAAVRSQRLMPLNQGSAFGPNQTTRSRRPGE